MNSIFLIELLLVFGAVLVWAFYEYRTADRLSKQHRDKPTQVSDDDAENSATVAGASGGTQAAAKPAADEASDQKKLR